MTKYTVIIPFAGSAVIEGVEADSEQGAIDAAFDLFDLDVKDGQRAALDQFESLDHIAEGNVCHAPVHRASASVEA